MGEVFKPWNEERAARSDGWDRKALRGDRRRRDPRGYLAGATEARSTGMAVASGGGDGLLVPAAPRR
jgi:hypothetical protein